MSRSPRTNITLIVVFSLALAFAAGLFFPSNSPVRLPQDSANASADANLLAARFRTGGQPTWFYQRNPRLGRAYPGHRPYYGRRNGR